MCLPADITSVRIASGLDIEFRESGARNGVPVILLHGVTDSLCSWRPFTDALPPTVRAFAITQRGHGGSSKPMDDYGSAALAGDVAGFMDAIGLKRAHVIGHSMGTWVAQRFARDHAARVESVTLIAGFVTLKGNPAVAALLEEIGGMETPDRVFVQAFQESTVALPMTPDFLDTVVGESLRVPLRVWKAAFAAMTVEEPDKRPLECRALLIGCGKDDLFPERDRRALAAMCSNGREILYPDLGHAPHWEDPRRVARDISAFLLQR